MAVSKVLRNRFLGFFVVLCSMDANAYEYCEIKIRVYDPCSAKNYDEYCIEDGIKAFSSRYYSVDPSLNTVIFGLPFQSNSSGDYIIPTIDALTSRCDFNIILLDNSNHTDLPYALEFGQLLANTYEDSGRYAPVINDAINAGLLRADNIVAVGFSIAAQLLGQVCRRLTAMNSTDLCGYIFGFDPAGPLFLPKAPLLPLPLPQTQLVSKSDACYVVLTHCNMGPLGLGTSFMSGNVDVIVNNGVLQPNCTSRPNLCSHLVCNSLQADILRFPGLYQAVSSYSNLNVTDDSETYTFTIPPTEKCTSGTTEDRKLYLKYNSESQNIPQEQNSL